MSDYVDVADFGASPNADYSTNTTAFQNALAYANTSGVRKVVCLIPGTYMLQGWEDKPHPPPYLQDAGAIKMYSNMTLELSDNVILKQTATDEPCYNIISVYNKENVTIRGG